MAQKVKNLPAMQEPWFGKTFWRRAWQPTPIFLPRESPGMEEPYGLQSMGSQRWKREFKLSTFLGIMNPTINRQDKNYVDELIEI